jgi:hypothetical protein
VVSRRSYRREAAHTLAEGEVHAIEDAARAGARGVPRALAGDGVRIETSAPRGDAVAYERDVTRVVRERELLPGRVPSLEMPDAREELRIIAQRSRDRPQAADVLGVAPAGVVTPTV